MSTEATLLWKNLHKPELLKSFALINPFSVLDYFIYLFILNE